MAALREVTTEFGRCVLKVAVTERQQRGMLFAPIHWNEANASSAASARWSPPSPIRFRASRR